MPDYELRLFKKEPGKQYTAQQIQALFSEDNLREILGFVESRYYGYQVFFNVNLWAEEGSPCGEIPVDVYVVQYAPIQYPNGEVHDADIYYKSWEHSRWYSVEYLLEMMQALHGPHVCESQL